MPEPFRPQIACWPVSRRLVATVGWAIAAAALLAGAAGVSPRIAPLASAVGGGFAASSAPAFARLGEQAVETMKRGEARLMAERAREGVPAEGEAADDASGLLGGEVTPLMTTLGSLEAKRLSTNPEWARALTLRLAGAGLGAGDLVAASFSGSFPGLNLALAAACRALDARLVAVSSVTASTWGANQPGFTWPEMEARLVGAGIIPRASIGVTAGGAGDMALDLEAGDRALAWRVRDQAAARLGVPALQPRHFDEAVRLRLAAYRRAANGRRIALYVNVGGAEASMGRSDAVLRLRSGFLPAVPFGRRGEQGVMARLAAEGVPMLMLLNVRELALGWGVPLSAR